MQFYTILPEWLKQLKTMDRVIVTCYLKFRAPVSWATLLLCSFASYKNLSSTYFPKDRMLINFRKIIPEERMPLVVLDFECLEWNNVKELGIIKDGIGLR